MRVKRFSNSCAILHFVILPHLTLDKSRLADTFVQCDLQLSSADKVFWKQQQLFDCKPNDFIT